MTRHETEHGGVPAETRTYIEVPPHTVLWQPVDHADDGQSSEMSHTRRSDEEGLPGERDTV